MSTKIKNLVPAAALVLAVAGTLSANAIKNNSSAQLQRQGWFGQTGAGETQISGQPTPATDCDGASSDVCAIRYVDDVPQQQVTGGLYVGG